jgi:hypothetical protein
MTNRFLFALLILFSSVEATVPARALPFPAAILDMQSSDASSAAVIPVRKGKGHGDGEDRFERHHRPEVHGSYRHRRHSHGMRGLNGNQGFGNYSRSGGGGQNQPDGQN